MAAIPTEVPREARAGDSIAWTRSLPDYPATDGWELKYQLVGSGFVASLTAAPAGADYAITAAAATTAAWVPGNATLVEYVTKAADRYTLGQTALKILPDLAAAASGVDMRSPAQMMLDTIEGWMRTQSPVYGSVQYGDRRIDQYDPAKLLEIRSRLKMEVAGEASGKGLTARVLVNL